MAQEKIHAHPKVASSNVYLDCNATTPTHPLAAEAALVAMQTLYGNPSSSHLAGIQAKSILESTRKKAGLVVDCDPDQVIFTSGATEAIQTAVFSALQSLRDQKFPDSSLLLYCATEHKAVPQALHHWVKALALPYKVLEIPVDSNGIIEFKKLETLIPHAALICTMAVNNETGVIQNLKKVEDLLNRSQSKALWLVDCVQALGKIKLSFRNSRIDYAAFSGHKLYATKGIGFLTISKRAPLVPLIAGGGQERGLRSGTENLPGVAALGAVLDLLLHPTQSGEEPFFRTEKQLKNFREILIAELRLAFPKVVFNAPENHTVPTTLNFSVPGFSSRELLDLFDSAGLRLSAGSACNSTSVEPSHVLDAMGLPLWQSTSALRLSFGPMTTEEEIRRGCHLIRQSAIALQTSCLLEAPGGFEAPEALREGVIQLRTGASNTWLIAFKKSKQCIIIDPCETLAERIEHYVRCQNLHVSAILDTHSHADHDSIRPLLRELLSDRMRDSLKTDSLGWPIDGAPIRLGPHEKSGEWILAKVHTPGHTDDSHTLLLGVSHPNKSECQLSPEDVRFAFCGDTILGGGLGRTNFLVSNAKDLYDSLKKIRSLITVRTPLCPAHDYTNSFATTLATEESENPLLNFVLTSRSNSQNSSAIEEFELKKNEIDVKLARIEETFEGTVCGVSSPSVRTQNSRPALNWSELQALMTSKKPLVIDVREPQEYTLFSEWTKFGFEQAPRNVPLSRFVNFIGEMLQNSAQNQEIVFICRTGNRSLQAAQSFRRLGFENAISLAGGISLMK